MKKNCYLMFIFLIVFSLAGTPSLDAVTIEIPWHVIYGTEIGSFELAIGTGVIVAGDGYIYTTGYSYNWDAALFGSPILMLNNVFEFDPFVAKWSKNGVLQWYTFLGGPLWDYGAGIDVDRDGNVYIAGYGHANWNETKYGPPLVAHNGGFYDAFVAKLNPNGQLLWYTFLGGDQSDRATSIKVTPQGNVFVSGSSNDEWDSSDFGDPVLDFNDPASYNNDVFVAKLNTNGILQWYTFLGSNYHEEAMALTVGPGESIFVTCQGLAYWPESKYGWPVIDKSIELDDLPDGLIARLTGNGAFEWYTFMGEEKSCFPNGIDYSNSGKIFVAGSVIDFPHVTLGKSNALAPLDNKLFAASFHLNGEKDWFKTPYVAKFSAGTSIDAGPFGDLYITGFGANELIATLGRAGINTSVEEGQFAFLMKMSPSGYVEWIENFAGLSLGFGMCVATFDNGLTYVTGNIFGHFLFVTPIADAGEPEPALPVPPTDMGIFLVQVKEFYTVSVMVKTTGGSVGTETFQIVPGKDCTINIFPDPGYEIEKIIDNGNEAAIANPYIISEVKNDHEVHVFFRLIQYPPELLLTGMITVDNAWIIKNEFADLTVTIIEHPSSPMKVHAYVLYKYVNGVWTELTRYTEPGTYSFMDRFSKGEAGGMYILKAVAADGSVIAESDILIL